MELKECDYCGALSKNGSDVKEWKVVKGYYGGGTGKDMCDKCYRPLELMLVRNGKE